MENVVRFLDRRRRSLAIIWLSGATARRISDASGHRNKNLYPTQREYESADTHNRPHRQHPLPSHRQKMNYAWFGEKKSENTIIVGQCLKSTHTTYVDAKRQRISGILSFLKSTLTLTNFFLVQWSKRGVCIDSHVCNEFKVPIGGRRCRGRHIPARLILPKFLSSAKVRA
jgi:hypothetical protein